MNRLPLFMGVAILYGAWLVFLLLDRNPEAASMLSGASVLFCIGMSIK